MRRKQRCRSPPVTPMRPMRRSPVLHSSPVHFLLRSAGSNSGLESLGTTEGLVQSEPRNRYGGEKLQGTRSCPRKVADLCRLFDAPSAGHGISSTPRRQKTVIRIPEFSEALSMPTVANVKSKTRTSGEVETKFASPPSKLGSGGKAEGRPCTSADGEGASPLKQKIHLFEDLSSSDAVDRLSGARRKTHHSAVGGPVGQVEVGTMWERAGTWRGKRAVGILRKISKTLDIHGYGDTEEVPLTSEGQTGFGDTAEAQRPRKKIVKRRLKRQPPDRLAGVAFGSTPDSTPAVAQEQLECKNATAEVSSDERQVREVPALDSKVSTRRRGLFKRKSLPFLKGMSALQGYNGTRDTKEIHSSRGSSTKVVTGAAGASFRNMNVVRGPTHGRTETLRRRFSASISKAMNPFRSAPGATASYPSGRRAARAGPRTNSSTTSEQTTGSGSNKAAVSVVRCNLQHPRPIRGSEVSLLIGLCERMERKGRR
ncbi:hypothetical protein MAPG_02748 [Magnaporthiopsis poae ATCC 64411]|uniref:Uncharacterized protein n=1 Tax=Magnaporthiopsis poae (strain ATCC 64411 / 73-15) TaxID=644358 RepID=A0A0C4DS71_MAGP6|nr:hypothetical protein MAPG_02748 [Magnaporthiopsis poae ATCC 64411]